MKKYWRSHKIRRWWIKLVHWEYWPIWAVYFPVSFYYLYLSIKAKSLFFFSASNPSIENGGLTFESKWKIFQLIPQAYYPTTLYIEAGTSLSDILQQLQTAALTFPLIAKPDRGERGWCVQKINSADDLVQYCSAIRIPFLLQAYVAQPMEFSVFYYRHPDSERGQVTSVTFKRLLSVVGDGKSTIEMLILQSNRAFLQYNRIKKNPAINLQQVLPIGQVMELVPLGNHCLGAMFVDYNHIITPAMHRSFDSISKSIKGFYFGRFDLRCNSVEDLQQAKNISILELNGAGAEPAHIYTPGFSFFKAQRILAQHYRMLYEAAIANQKKNIPFMRYQDFKLLRRAEKQFKQTAVIA